MQWNLNKLKHDTSSLYGVEQEKLLAPCLQSVFERQEFSGIYYHQAQNTMNKFLGDDNDSSSLLKLALRTKKDWTDWDQCQLEVKAHIISCLQNLHIVSDNLGHVIYYCLGLNLSQTTKLDSHKISLKSVKLKIRKVPDCQLIASFLDELTGSEDYRYLNRIVNHSKHRSIVEPFLNLNLRAAKGSVHEIWFREFEYSGKHNDRRLSFSFLEREFDRQDLLVIQLGNALSGIIEARLLSKRNTGDTHNLTT